MRFRHLDMSDVQHVLRYGMVTKITPAGEHWRYRIEGKTVDGKPADCVVEINGRMLIDIAIKNVSIEDLRTSPYKATVDFEKIYFTPSDHLEIKRERWLAHES